MKCAYHLEHEYADSSQKLLGGSTENNDNVLWKKLWSACVPGKRR